MLLFTCLRGFTAAAAFSIQMAAILSKGNSSNLPANIFVVFMWQGKHAIANIPYTPLPSHTCWHFSVPCVCVCWLFILFSKKGKFLECSAIDTHGIVQIVELLPRHLPQIICCCCCRCCSKFCCCCCCCGGSTTAAAAAASAVTRVPDPDPHPDRSSPMSCQCR